MIDPERINELREFYRGQGVLRDSFDGCLRMYLDVICNRPDIAIVPLELFLFGFVGGILCEREQRSKVWLCPN